MSPRQLLVIQHVERKGPGLLAEGVTPLWLRLLDNLLEACCFHHPAPGGPGEDQAIDQSARRPSR